MKLMNASTALRTALVWLHKALHQEQPIADQQWVEYSKQISWRHTPRLLPPPQPQPIQAGGGCPLHMPTGVWRKTYLARMANPEPTQKLPSVKGLYKPHFYRLGPSPEEAQADKWLLDAEPIAPESALDQLAQLAETDVKLEAVRQRHEGRGKAS